MKVYKHGWVLILLFLVPIFVFLYLILKEAEKMRNPYVSYDPYAWMFLLMLLVPLFVAMWQILKIAMDARKRMHASLLNAH